jgi:hypothetical protein
VLDWLFLMGQWLSPPHSQWTAVVPIGRAFLRIRYITVLVVWAKDRG